MYIYIDMWSLDRAKMRQEDCRTVRSHLGSPAAWPHRHIVCVQSHLNAERWTWQNVLRRWTQCGVQASDWWRCCGPTGGQVWVSAWIFPLVPFSFHLGSTGEGQCVYPPVDVCFSPEEDESSCWALNLQPELREEKYELRSCWSGLKLDSTSTGWHAADHTPLAQCPHVQLFQALPFAPSDLWPFLLPPGQ